MKRVHHTLLKRFWGICICFFYVVRVNYAQDDGIPTSVWLLSGISFQNEEGVKLLGQLGKNDAQAVKAIYFQSFIPLSEHIIFNPGYLYLQIPVPGTLTIEEHGIMNALLFTFPLRGFIIDDRNMFWSRFRANSKDAHMYRNRLRFSKPFSLKTGQLRLYIYNEGWLYINKFYCTRNRIAAGIACDIRKWLNLDLSFVRQHDKYSGTANLYFLQATYQLFDKKK